MNKTFFVFSKEHIHFLESIDTGSLFSLGTKELELLKSKDEKVIEFLFDKKIIKKEETSDNLFSAVFLVNDFCNLQCSYCFENGSEKNRSFCSTLQTCGTDPAKRSQWTVIFLKIWMIYGVSERFGKWMIHNLNNRILETDI